MFAYCAWVKVLCPTALAKLYVFPDLLGTHLLGCLLSVTEWQWLPYFLMESWRWVLLIWLLFSWTVLNSRIKIGAYLNWHFQLVRSQVSAHNVWDKKMWKKKVVQFGQQVVRLQQWKILSTSLSDWFLLLIDFSTDWFLPSKAFCSQFLLSINFCCQMIFVIDRFLLTASCYWPFFLFPFDY